MFKLMGKKIVTHFYSKGFSSLDQLPFFLFFTRYDKQCLESNLSDKDNQASMSAAENKLQKTIEETEHLKDKLKQLEEDLQLAQENLQITLTERDTFKTDLEAVKQQNSDILDELQNNKAEFDKKLCELETERDELTLRVKQMEGEKVIQSGNTAEIQSLLDEKTSRIEDLEKSFGAMKNGYIWLQGIKENQTYNEVSLLGSLSLIGESYKISNTFLFLFSNKIWFLGLKFTDCLEMQTGQTLIRLLLHWLSW